MIGTIEMLRNDIRSWDRGRIFYIEEFASYESQWSVRFGLGQLVDEGLILRLARGIYCYPHLSEGYSPHHIIPTEESIAESLAQREHVRIIPYGDQAARKLGLNSIVVSHLKYLTDGSPRVINLSNGRKIYFNHTSEVKMFDFCNETMQLVSAAIRVLKPELIGEEQRRIIHSHLRTVPDKEFHKDLKIPPAWVQEIILDIWNN